VFSYFLPFTFLVICRTYSTDVGGHGAIVENSMSFSVELIKISRICAPTTLYWYQFSNFKCIPEPQRVFFSAMYFTLFRFCCTHENVVEGKIVAKMALRQNLGLQGK
jgi:hypothetical protein